METYFALYNGHRLTPVCVSTTLPQVGICTLQALPEHVVCYGARYTHREYFPARGHNAVNEITYNSEYILAV